MSYYALTLFENRWGIQYSYVRQLCTLDRTIEFLNFLEFTEFSEFGESDTVADPNLGARVTAPYGPEFLYFHTVFGKNWSNSMLVPLRGLFGLM